MPLLSRKRKINTINNDSDDYTENASITQNTFINCNRNENGEEIEDTEMSAIVDDMDDLDVIITESVFDRENIPPEPISQRYQQSQATIISECLDSQNVGLDFDNPSSIQNNTLSSYQESLRKIAMNNVDTEKNDQKGSIGHIEEITLQNFMCHTNFHLELGPRVNFIVGQNGSGKSAILNGIVLGLGGRASNTNRGSGLSTFIKNGEQKARIVIKISNYSETLKSEEYSYMFERYGKSIIIERNILQSGHSSYKIKSESGKVISEKKEELDNILKHHSIYIDNPICVLTQEVSKNFLNSKSASDKFKFFVKATQIEDTKKDYEISKINHMNSLHLIQEKEDLLHSYQNKLEEFRRKVEIIEILRNNVIKIKSLHEEALWADIIQSEKELVIQNKKLEEYEAKCEDHFKRLDKIQENRDQIQQRRNELQEKLDNFSDEIKQARESLEMAKEKALSSRNELSQLESNLRAIKNDLNLHNNEIKVLQNRIDGIERNSQQCEQMDIDTMIKNLGEKIDQNKTETEELKSRIIQLQTDQEEKIKIRVNMTEEERKIGAQVSAYKTELERLNQSQQNRLARYGPKFPELNAQIELFHKQGKFKHRPYGPIGEYIHLEDNQAALAVECCLKTFLFAYVVDNGDDAYTLKQLVSRLFVGQKTPTIIIRKYSPLHDVSQRQALSPKHKNFLQLMNIKREHDPVANCLIDHCRVEQILFIPDFREAQYILLRKELVPNNCTLAYTAGGDMMYPSNKRGDYKCYVNKKNKLAKILIQDNAKHKEHYKRSIEDLKKRQLIICEKSRQIQSEIEECKKQITLINYKTNQLNIDKMTLETELGELKRKTKIKPIEAQALKEEVQKLETERDNLSNELEQLIEKRKELLENYVKSEKEKESKEVAYDNVMESRDPIKDEIEKLNYENEKFSQKLNQMEKEKDDLLALKYKQEKDIEIRKENLSNNEASALLMTKDRIETKRTNQQITKEIKKIEMIIKENQNMCNVDSQNKIVDEYQQLDNSIKRVRADLDNLKQYFDMFQKSLTHRQKAYLKMRLYLTNIVNFYFHNFLKQKDFIGQISVYFQDYNDEENGIKKKAKTLDLEIKPRKEFVNLQNSDTHSYSSTKSLSGGERSFSTVAFIIALWEVCPSPFKILDEVDVFMDMVTRKISLDTLVEFAAVKSKKQFIFLSPLQIQQFQHVDCIKIFQMPEPERRN